MRRVDIAYGGNHYSLPRTTVEDVKRTIEEALAAPEPQWLTVNFGEGKPQPVEILIRPGIPLALAQVSTEDNERPEVHSDEMGSLDAPGGSE
jgi:hypothetical protein